MKQWIVWIFALFVLLYFITPLFSDGTKLIDNEMEIFQVPNLGTEFITLYSGSGKEILDFRGIKRSWGQALLRQGYGA